jgi:vacuolar protein sorting-associated protein VTA1
MAANIPNSLKAADVGRFLTRASQIERAKPVVAYWCTYFQFSAVPVLLRQLLIFSCLAGNYWVVNQIISKGLHNSDDETVRYTTSLMDKLEQVCSPPRLPRTSSPINSHSSQVQKRERRE